MKRTRVNLKSGQSWLLLLLATSLFFSFITWLTAPQAFKYILPMMVIFIIAVSLTGYRINEKKQKRQQEALENFLSDPDEQTEQKLLATIDPYWHTTLQNVSAHMRKQEQVIKDNQLELQNYEEFIEAWAHEIKTPLSLATLVLDNHKEDMSPYVYKRLEHVRHTINGDVEKVLYYARLYADHSDYTFEKIDLKEFMHECIYDFYAIVDEKNIDLQLHLLPIQVISDKKVLAFILAQLLCNAFKYTASENGKVHISSWQYKKAEEKIHLSISNNGHGVAQEDVPFLFDKGFTGNHPDRQEATGMGLYLTKKYAEALSIDVMIGAAAEFGKGFEIELVFPKVL